MNEQLDQQKAGYISQLTEVGKQLEQHQKAIEGLLQTREQLKGAVYAVEMMQKSIAEAGEAETVKKELQPKEEKKAK
jgi:hypothetical protein